ncbi:MAG: ATP-binding protein [Kofleriaceae bacterium]
MTTLHFIYGLPAAGKTGLARALAAEIPGLFICQDEWLLSLGGTITTVEQYVEAAGRVRRLITPLISRVLELGVSVVLDFAANTVNDRAWVRSMFEAARADHVLHVLDVPIDECKRRLHARNAEQPPGLYFGHVSEELFDQIVPYIGLPTPEEGFHVVRATSTPGACGA